MAPPSTAEASRTTAPWPPRRSSTDELDLTRLVDAMGPVALAGSVDRAIVYVHALTVPAAVRVLAGVLPADRRPAALAHTWQAMAGLAAAFPVGRPADLAADMADAAGPVPSADELVDAAVANGDEHAIKVAAAALDEVAHGADERPLVTARALLGRMGWPPGCLTGWVTEEPPRIARRTFLGVAAAGALAACAPNPTGEAGVRTEAADEPTAAPATASSVPPAAAPPETTAAQAVSTTATAAGAAAFVPNGPRDRRQVSLTFHANGDAGMATAILDVLAARGVRVTVFGVGNWLVENPALVRRMVADGHEVANHTWSHQPMGRLDRATLATEITRCAEALTGLIGSPSPWFRPSGIEVPTPAILAEAGRAGYATSVGYDCDSLDFQDPGAAAVVANVAATVKPGSIISVHFGHRNTVEAMPALLDLLVSRDLRPVTVGELLA